MDDYGQKETDKLLEELEKKISREYAAAVKDMEKKCDEYLSKFEVKDKKWRQEVKDGIKTESEYESWRKGQMMTGYRWEAMKSQLAEDCHNANVLARSITNGYMPEAYAINHNYGTYYIEKNAKVDTSYTLYDRQTVERLIRDEPDLLQMPGQQMKQTFEDFDTYKSGGDVKLTDKQKKAFDKLIADGKDIRWQKGQIQSVTLQSILQGESIPHMSKRIADTMGEINHKASVRYARTAMTGAQNAGRTDSYKRANRMGIKTRQTWVATLDNRTRHSHALMEGETIDADGTFSNGLRFPGDPRGDPAEVWNCRCTTVAQIKGFETDIRDPNVTIDTDMGEMTYDEWKEYHASSSKKEEEKPEESRQVVQGHDISSTWKRRPDEFEFEIEDVLNAQGFDGLPKVVAKEEFDKAVKAANGGEGFIAQRSYSAPTKETIDDFRDQLYNGKWYVDCSTGGAQYGQGMYCAADYNGVLSSGIQEEMEHYRKIGERRYEDAAKVVSKTLGETLDEFYAKNGRPLSYTETLTLDPSAKIVKYRDLEELRSGYERSLIEREIEKLSVDERYKFVLRDRIIGVDDADEATKKNAVEWYRNMTAEERKEFQSTSRKISKSAKENAEKAREMDNGSFAAMLGYDAINAEGHGKSGSYTVILNRTKAIFLKGE